MSGTVTKGERFKAAFGVISKSVLAEKKKQVGDQITKLESESTGLSDAPSHLAYHPGAKGVAKTYETIRARFDKVAGTEKEQFKALEEIEKQTKAALKALPALKEGEKQLATMKTKKPDEIDKIVSDLGSKVKTPEDRGTVIAAIKARYDLDELGGELTSNALPRLYKTLGIVPENHTKDNPMFQKLVRSKMSDTSLYFTGKGELAINAGETGPFSSEREKYTDGAGKKMEFSRFDAHTLHEVGHSVDDASGYMDKHGKEASHGGWRKTDGSTAAAAKAKELQSKYPKLSPAFLTEAVNAGLNHDKIDNAVADWKNKKGAFDTVTKDGLLKDPAVRKADAAIRKVKDAVSFPLTPEDKITVQDEFGQLTDAVKPSPLTGAPKTLLVFILRSMRDLVLTADEVVGKMKDTIDAANDPTAMNKLSADILAWSAPVKKELWWKSGVIPQVQVGGRVYQKDGDSWWSYDFGSRAQMVKDYQFRSPAEWFAEVYTVAMLGKLAPSHPCAKAIKSIDTTQKIT